MESEQKLKAATESSDEQALNEQELDQISGGDEAPKETTTFEYGGLQIRYTQQH